MSRSPSPRRLNPRTRNDDGEARVHRRPGRNDHDLARAAQHVAPRRRRRLDAEAQEAQRGLQEYGHREREGDLDDERHEDVGQEVAEQDVAGARPVGARGAHELAGLEGENGAAADPGELGDVDDADREDHVECLLPEDGHDEDREEKGGEGEQDVGHPHDPVVPPPAEVAGPDPHERADRRRRGPWPKC